MKTYDDMTKRKIVAEYAKWDGTRPDFLSKYAIPNSTLHQWIHIYSTQKYNRNKTPNQTEAEFRANSQANTAQPI